MFESRHLRVKRKLARLVYRIGALLSYIKTPRRTYSVVSFDPFVTEPSQRKWLPCRPSMRMYKLSMRLDWDHWGHWALVHDDCNGSPCAQCGGIDCGN